MLRATAVCASAVVLPAAIYVRTVYLAPQIDALSPADAIVVLGGPGFGRYDYGIDLGRAGYAPRVVLSDPSGGENEQIAELCNATFDFDVECFDPEPKTTAGEARHIASLADSKAWDDIIVVTFTPHVSRARFIVGLCYDGALSVVAGPDEPSPVQWMEQIGYQTAGYVKAVIQPAC